MDKSRSLAPSSLPKVLSDNQKLDVVADIDSLESQLQKPEPKKSVAQVLCLALKKSLPSEALSNLILSRDDMAYALEILEAYEPTRKAMEGTDSCEHCGKREMRPASNPEQTVSND